MRKNVSSRRCRNDATTAKPLTIWWLIAQSSVTHRIAVTWTITHPKPTLLRVYNVERVVSSIYLTAASYLKWLATSLIVWLLPLMFSTLFFLPQWNVTVLSMHHRVLHNLCSTRTAKPWFFVSRCNDGTYITECVISAKAIMYLLTNSKQASMLAIVRLMKGSAVLQKGSASRLGLINAVSGGCGWGLGSSGITESVEVSFGSAVYSHTKHWCCH